MGSCELRVGVMVRFWDEDEEEEGKAGGRKSQVNHLFPWGMWGAPPECRDGCREGSVQLQ